MPNQVFPKILFVLMSLALTPRALASSWIEQQLESPSARALMSKSSSPVIVAVIDTGMDLNHPALKNNLWTNPGETGRDRFGQDKARNGVDDDHNGWIDDVHGWNFVENNSNLRDSHGHGTHIAGIIASQAPAVKLMILKYYDPHRKSEDNVRNSIRALKYAAQMEAQIVNYSGGGPGANLEEERALQILEKNKILLVAAAGNDGMNVDQAKYYPAFYPLKNILSVTATGPQKRLPAFANFGSASVHIAAPGEHIRSTLPGGGFGEMSGTSQATAFASAVAALLLAQNPLLADPEILIEKIQQTGRSQNYLEGKTKSASLLNARRALSMKSITESAAGFVFEPNSDSKNHILSASSLDLKGGLGQGGLERKSEN